MFWKIRLTVVALCLLAAGPAHAGQPGGFCTGPAVSAQNQYCENIPSAGGHTPAGARGAQRGGPAGSASVGSTLPPNIVREVDQSTAAGGRRELLKLPAPARSHPVVGPADTSPWSLALLFVLILLAIIATMALATVRRRQRRPVQAT